MRTDIVARLIDHAWVISGDWYGLDTKSVRPRREQWRKRKGYDRGGRGAMKTLQPGPGVLSFGSCLWVCSDLG